MVRNSAQAATVLMPISLSHRGRTSDLSLPSSLPVAELLPGMVEALGHLDAETASRGMHLLTSDGRVLDQTTSLTAQGISAGAVLTLEAADAGTSALRYDDLVEAIGTSVDESQSPWSRGDSVRLSSYAAVGLFVVAALLLLLRGTTPVLTALIGFVGAALVTLTAAATSRASAPGGPTALAVTAPLLAATGAQALGGGPWYGTPLLLAGAGAVVGSAASTVLPRGLRITAAGPLTVGAALALVGALTSLAGIPEDRAATLVVASLTVLTLAAPWIGLAQVPSRITALTGPPRGPIDVRAVRQQVRDGEILVLSLKCGACATILGLTPLVASTPAGGALMACTGFALMLSTRSLHGRAEVFVGVLTGMSTMVVTGVVATLAEPRLLPWTIAAVVLVGVLVLAMNVVSPRMRPWLTRLADAANVVALLAVLPLAAAVWGVL